jgi:hypothetical protein
MDTKEFEELKNQLSKLERFASENMSDLNFEDFLKKLGEDPKAYSCEHIWGEVSVRDHLMAQSIAKLTLAGQAMSRGAIGVSSQKYSVYGTSDLGTRVGYEGMALIPIPKNKSPSREELRE